MMTTPLRSNAVARDRGNIRRSIASRMWGEGGEQENNNYI
jgi:hypothetical protein